MFLKELAGLMFSVLYHDEHLAAINKPAGLISHPVGILQGTSLTEEIYQYFGNSARLMHRLDKDTSGILLVALNPWAVRVLYRLFERQQIEKKYLALVYGEVCDGENEISFPIGSASSSLIKIKMAVRSDGSPATTHYQTLQKNKDASLLLVTPLSGRKHQIRVHLAAIGHPIIGDNLYYKAGLPFLWEYYLHRNSPWQQQIERQALHAYRLSFVHPATKENMEIIAPLHEDFLQCLQNYSFSFK